MGRIRRRRGGGFSWGSFVLRRLLSLIAILFTIGFASFVMIPLVPGDPARAVGGINATEEQIEAIRRDLGLDRPFLEQFYDYFSNAIRGDFGTSFVTGDPVSAIISRAWVPTAQLAGAALLCILVLALLLGILAAAASYRSRSPRRGMVFSGISAAVGAVPEFIMAMLLAFIFAVTLRWLPIAGAGSLSALVLPVAAVTIRPMFTLARIVRVETLNVLAQDYIRTARSKRLSAARIYVRHVTPNVLNAALAVGGVLFAGLLGGAVVVETIFNRPGLGSILVNSVLARDYPVTQGVVLVMGLTVVIVNAIIDALLVIVDPRSLVSGS